MQRAWITGLTLAGVLGTGGAAFAGMSITHTDGNSVEAQAPALASDTTLGTSATTYRLGNAGTVTISVTGGAITIVSAEPAAGWTLVGSSVPGTHVEVQLSDGTQVLTFSADLVDGAAVAALAAAPSAAAAPAAPAPATQAAPAIAAAPAPRPATPVVVLEPTPRQPVVTTAGTVRPPRTTVTSPGIHTTEPEHQGGGSDD